MCGFSPFPRIFRYLLLCKTDVLVLVSCSVFEAENGGEVRFTLCLAVVEILHIQLLSKSSKCSARPSSSTTQDRVKRTSPSFSASKTEWETITKTSVLQGSKNPENGKTIYFLIFSIFSAAPQFVEQTFY